MKSLTQSLTEIIEAIEKHNRACIAEMMHILLVEYSVEALDKEINHNDSSTINQRDAERYRWIRSWAGRHTEMPHVDEPTSPEHMDRIVDAALDGSFSNSGGKVSS